jgi:HEAT repeat protein
MSERVEARLEAIPHLEEVDPGDRAGLFELILTDFSCEVRVAAAAAIFLCPPAYPKFLADPVPGVRIAVVNQSLRLRAALGDPSAVLDELATLTKDPVADVRCAFARVLHAHAKVDGDCDARELTLRKVAPLVLEMLGDHSDDVKLAASLNLVELAVVYGYDFVFEELSDHLHSILTDRQWRVRNTGIQLNRPRARRGRPVRQRERDDVPRALPH